ncbi:hypothetical protein HK104_005749 [Borealophlyctis nickersoniae]|nr:hypothetical protein HK104_005749 [Borealophlyctis nickersoniae]
MANPKPGGRGATDPITAVAQAALAAQAELEPLENAKVEAEIPDELKEQPPPEMLFALDRRMDELLSDIRLLQESRGKDFQNTIGRKDRVPALPDVSVYEKYKQIRTRQLERVTAVELPQRTKTASKLVAEESEYTDAVDRFERLAEAYENKEKVAREMEAKAEADRIEQEKRGLLPGGRPKGSAGKNKQPTTAKPPNPPSGKTEKPKVEDTAPPPSGASATGGNGVAPTEKPREDDLGEDVFASDPVFEVGDLVVFLRWMICESAAGRDLEVYLRRVKTLIHTDRLQLLKDYRFIVNLTPAMGTLDSMSLLDGINNFITHPPARIPRPEDFLTEFDLLVTHHSITCPITQEDGRPFGYEVDGRFVGTFEEQCAEAVGGPYESLGEEGGTPGSGTGAGNAQGGPGTGKEGEKASLAAIAGVFSKPGFKSPKAPRLRHADWIHDVRIYPRYEEWQEAQIDALATRKEIDFELNCEHDLILSSDIDQVTSRLRETARRLYEAASPTPSSSRPGSARMQSASDRKRPSTAGGGANTSTDSTGSPGGPSTSASGGPTTGGPRITGPSVLPPDDDPLRLLKPFDLGMQIPNGRIRIGELTVLEGKKQQFGLTLRNNAELLKVEQELLREDPGRILGPHPKEPTIATLFAEHEIYAFLQLRHIRLRELRAKLLRQLNFFRSVEKRITLDSRATKKRTEIKLTDAAKHEQAATNALATASIVAHMWHQQDLFEMPDPTSAPPARPGSAPASAGTAAAGGPSESSPSSTEDVRQIVDGWVIVRDHRGTSLLYDAAIEDMKVLERNLLKFATIIINNGAGGVEHLSTTYMDELRFQFSERRTEFQDATFLNPKVDRAQLLLELFEAEVKFQYAKIELVNLYLEVFEHTSDVPGIEKIAQIITNIIHLRPFVDMEDYATQTKSIEIQSRTILEMIQHMTSVHRAWLRRHFLKIDKSVNPAEDNELALMPAEAEMGLAAQLDTPLAAGLPLKPDTDRQTVMMHHAGVIVEMTEIVPAIERISEVWDAARTACAEMGRTIEYLLPDLKCSRHAVECAVWKGLHAAWSSLSSHAFRPPARARRLVGPLDSDVWLENPLLPDIILAERYVPFEQENAGTARSLGVAITSWTPFTHPEFASKAREMLHRIMRTVLLRDRLLFSWIETEYWKKAYELQFPQMGITNKAIFTGRLNSLRFDLPDIMDTTAVEDDADKDYSENGEYGSETDEDAAAIRFDASLPKYNALAVAELDEACARYDFFAFVGILGSLTPAGTHQLRFSLKTQVLEKTWLMAAVELNSLLLSEIHSRVLTEKEEDRPKVEKSKGTQRRQLLHQSQPSATLQTFDVDYRMLVTSMLPKKRALRKLILAEYAKESKNFTRQELKEEVKESMLLGVKKALLDWYFSNMFEVAVEECERVEYAKLMLEFRKVATSCMFGKLLFRPSKILKNVDYFTGQEKVSAETDTDPSRMNMQGVQIQEVVFTELGGVERVCKLWYLPHLTEIVTTPTCADKPSKTVDTSQKLFQNSLIFQRSYNLQSMLFDLFSLVGIYGHLLQDNNRYGGSVAQIREAEYAVNTLNAVKKDMSYQGPQAEYARAESYLFSKWNMWYLKLKLAIASSMYILDMNMMPVAYNILASRYNSTTQLGKRYDQDGVDTESCKLMLRPTGATLRPTPTPTAHVFTSLPPNAIPFCQAKVSELEECLEEYLQATLLNFGENAEDLNRAQTEFLVSTIKLVALRREYLRVVFGDETLSSAAMAEEFYRVYKMRILTWMTAHLLSNDMVVATVDFDFNRIAQVAFEKCQVAVLQNELLCEYTRSILYRARHYYDRLSDERTGRLFKLYESIESPPASGQPAFAFKLSEEAYEGKAGILNAFVADLWKAAGAFVREFKTNKPAKGAKPIPGAAALIAPGGPFDEARVFACTKEALSQSIVKLAIQLSKWHEKRRMDHDHFTGTLYARLAEMVRNGERLVKFLAQEKKDMIENYKRDVRLSTSSLMSSLYTELSTISVDLNDLRKSRRIDEKKLRLRIIDEYDDLVNQLVSEINVLRNRFSEYRINTVNEVLGIMTGVKREELMAVVANREIPGGMRDRMRVLVEADDALADLRGENHELKMTLLKVRSMFVMKELALRSMYEKQARKFTEDNKRAEEKLWDSYRDAEAREQALRRQLAKSQKACAAKETENEVLQRQLRDEQQRVRQLTPIKDRASSARGGRGGHAFTGNPDSDAAKIHDLQERLRRYEGINIDVLVHELSEKTRLLEELVAEKRERERGVGGMTGARARDGTEVRRRAASARLHVPSALVRGAAVSRKNIAAFDQSKAEEESSLGARIEKELNHQLLEKLNFLAMENNLLKKHIIEAGMEVPKLEETSKEGVTAKVAWEDDGEEIVIGEDQSLGRGIPSTREQEEADSVSALLPDVVVAESGTRPSSRNSFTTRPHVDEDTRRPLPDRPDMPIDGRSYRSTTTTPVPPRSTLSAPRRAASPYDSDSTPSHPMERRRPSGSAKTYRTVSRFVDAPYSMRGSIIASSLTVEGPGSSTAGTRSVVVPTGRNAQKGQLWYHSPRVIVGIITSSSHIRRYLGFIYATTTKNCTQHFKGTLR